MTVIPFWAAASLVSASEPPLDFQVSLEDMISDTGRLLDGPLSKYAAKGTPFQRGDILFGKLRPYLAKYWLADRPGTAGGDIHVYRPEANIEPRYLVHIVGSRNFVRFAEAASKGVKMPRAEWISLREFPMIHHDIATQKTIASYLDRETARIDSIVAKMDELASVLRARMAAFKATVLLQTTERLALRWMVADINTGPFGTQVKQEEYVSDGVPLINPSHLSGGRLAPEPKVSVSSSKAENLSRFALSPGDVVVARRGELGRAAVVYPEDLPALCGTGSLRIRPDYDRALPEYIHLVVSSQEAGRELEQLSVGATMGNLNERLLGEMHVPVLTTEKQQDVLDDVSGVTGRIEAMLSKVARLKLLLIERRAALISDVVTGRKKVA